MRDDDGWRWLRNSSGIVASVCGLIVTPVLAVVAVAVLLVPFVLSSFDYSQDPGPRDLGIGIDAQGAVTARVPICVSEGAQLLQLLGPDDVVLWQAESVEPIALESFVLGVTPEGFTEIIPFAGPLDPQAVYDLQMHTDLATESPTPSTEPTDGAHTEFRQADLVADQVYLASQTVAPDEFDDAACADRSD